MNTSEINIGIDISKARTVSRQEIVNASVQVQETENSEQNDKQVAAEIPSKKEVAEIVESIHEFVNMVQTKLNFSVREETNDIVVRVIDRETNEIIRQIPAEEILKVQARMQELSGILFDKNV